MYNTASILYSYGDNDHVLPYRITILRTTVVVFYGSQIDRMNIDTLARGPRQRAILSSREMYDGL